MRQFVFVRHGQTDWNKNGCGLGYADLPLNEDGIAEAKAASVKINEIMPAEKIPLILASPLIRTRQTAEIIAKTKSLKITLIESLQERFFGNNDKPGETDNEFDIRVKEALKIIAATCDNPNIFLIVVSHSIFFAKLAELLKIDAPPIATGGIFPIIIRN